MDFLIACRIFIRVAETGSFSAVARESGTTQPAVSRQVAALEEHLQTRLVQRSTRSLTLTEDGHDFLGHARAVTEAAEQAEAAVGQRRGGVSGVVRLGSPPAFGRLFVAPRLGALLARHPQLSVELELTDDRVDMVQTRLDLSLRVGPALDPTLVARRVGSSVHVVVASPDYLESHGEPTRPEDLAGHDCVIFTRMPDPQSWDFLHPGGEGVERREVRVPVAGRIRTDSIEAAMAVAMAGSGIAKVPAWMLREALRAGRLRKLLTEWQPERRPVSLVYPSRRFLAPRTRAVIDFIVEEFRLDPAISAYGES